MKRVVIGSICSALILITIGTGCTKKDKVSLNNNEKIKNVQISKDDDKFIGVDVYFDASKEEKSVQVAKETVLFQTDEMLGEFIMGQLIKGPSIKSKLNAVLPKDTRLISFSIKDGIAIVNLSKEAVVPMSKGKEEACLKSIASSLSQLSSVSKVAILVENNSIDSLGGNFDISKPFGKDEIVEKSK